MARGKLIVLEGLDGCGKATQAKLLFEKIKNKRDDVCKISFPDYSEPSSSLVKMYLNSEFGASPEEVNVYAASSFYAVDRYASFKKFWKNKYESGYIIIADRYTTSNAIYQLAQLEKSHWDEYLDWLQDYEYVKLEMPCPDLVIYLNMPIEVSQKLMTQRYNGDESQKDIFEKNISVLNKCREAAQYTAKKWQWKTVNCSCDEDIKSIEEINCEIEEILKNLLSV